MSSPRAARPAHISGPMLVAARRVEGRARDDGAPQGVTGARAENGDCTAPSLTQALRGTVGLLRNPAYVTLNEVKGLLTLVESSSRRFLAEFTLSAGRRLFASLRLSDRRAQNDKRRLLQQPHCPRFPGDAPDSGPCGSSDDLRNPCHGCVRGNVRDCGSGDSAGNVGRNRPRS